MEVVRVERKPNAKEGRLTDGKEENNGLRHRRHFRG